MKKNFLTKICISGIIASVFLINVNLSSQDNFDYSVIGKWSDGPCTSIDTFGSYVIINNGCNFEILKFQGESELIPLSKYFSQGAIYSLRVKNDKVFLGLNSMGLSIVDISDPADPHEISFLRINNYNPIIEIMGNKLMYATNSNTGFFIIDISDPNFPVIIKTLSVTGLRKMVAKGNYLFAARGWSGMSILELKDDDSLNSVFSISDRYCYDAKIMDGNLCVLFSDTLVLYDVSSLSNPVIKMKMKISDAYNCGFYNNYLVCSGYGMQAVDFSNINQPKLIVSDNNGIAANNMIVKDKIIFLALDSKGFKVMKIDPAGKISAVIVHETSGYSCGVAVKNKTAYLAQYSQGLSILDITDQNDIKWIKTLPLTYATSFKVKDNYLLCSNNGLMIFNIIDPANPLQLSYIDLKTATWGMKISGNIVYLASGSKGLTIIDISNINSPKIIAELDTPGSAWDIDIKDGKAFVADQKEGLRIINIEDPVNPVEIASSKVLTNIYSVAVAGNSAYVGSANYGIRVLDISDPNAIYIKKYMNNARGYRIMIEGNMAYIAGGYEGLVVLDITNPDDPVQSTVFNSPGNVYDVFIDNGYVYLADYEAGFNIIKKCKRFTITPDYNSISCYGLCDGWIDIKNVENASNPVVYNWNNGMNTSQISGLCKGTYSVTISDSQSCSASYSFDIMEPKPLKIENLVKNDITINNPKGSIDLEITGGYKTYKYNWSGPNGFSSTQQNINGLNKGCYTCTITDAASCIFVTDPICIEDNTIGIDDIDKTQLFRISPNPAKNNLIVEILSSDFSYNGLSIFSCNSKMVLENKQQIQGSQNSINIDISGLIPGIYYLKVNEKKGKICQILKVIKI